MTKTNDVITLPDTLGEQLDLLIVLLCSTPKQLQKQIMLLGQRIKEREQELARLVLIRETLQINLNDALGPKKEEEIKA